MFVIDCLISEIVTKLTATPEKTTALIRRLSLTEYGIAGYCRKFACELDPNLIPFGQSQHPNIDNQLASFLWEQYLEERLHGRMLASLIGNEKLKHQYLPSTGFVGGEEVQGLSKLSPFWWLLSGKRAKDLSLGDRLAMMAVLEYWAMKFYECLSHVLPDCPLGRLAEKISIDEIEHSETLYALLINSVGKIKAKFLIWKWYLKSLFILPEVVRLALAFAHNSNAEVKINA